MKTQFMEQETILKSGGANLQRDLETVGGRLLLTNMRLLLEPHAVNIQKNTEIILLSDIKEISFGWTKFLGIIPGFPNCLVVSTANQQFRFTVYGRKKWSSAILQQR